METPDLPGEFNSLRKAIGLTLLEIANRCDLHETTIHKIESGRTVRWETMHLVLTAGMKLPPASRDYERIHLLWMAQRASIASSKPSGKGKKRASTEEVAALGRFRKIIAGRDPREIRLILSAAARRAASLGMDG